MDTMNTTRDPETGQIIYPLPANTNPGVKRETRYFNGFEMVKLDDVLAEKIGLFDCWAAPASHAMDESHASRHAPREGVDVTIWGDGLTFVRTIRRASATSAEVAAITHAGIW